MFHGAVDNDYTRVIMTLEQELIRLAKRNQYITPSDALKAFEKVYPVSSRIKGMGTVKVAVVLQQLVKSNILHQSYKIMLPDGYLSYNDFSDPREIPEMYSIYPTADLEVVPVFYLNICYRGQ